MITDKNKEEIEKIKKEQINQRKISQNLFGQNRISQLHNSYEKENILENRKQERIKTSIQWCEDEIEFIYDEISWEEIPEIELRLRQFEIHLTWLKKQEEDLK